MAIKLKTPPAGEPVSLSEARAYLRINDTDDDALITSIVNATRQKCEAWTGRALITQTWTLWLDRFPRQDRPNSPLEGVFDLPKDFFDEALRFIAVPRPPLQTVTFVKTYDTGNSPLTFDAANYIVDTASEPGRIALNASSSWPTDLRAVNGVEIEFIAGYSDAANVPDTLKQGILFWLKLLFADKSKLYESDESTTGLLQMNRETIPPQVKALWEPYRLLHL